MKNATDEVDGRGQSLLKTSTGALPPQVCMANLLDPIDGFDSLIASLKQKKTLIFISVFPYYHSFYGSGRQGQSLLKTSTGALPPQVCMANLLVRFDGFDSLNTFKTKKRH
ncbi:MAG: hypothetical protein HDR55_02770 [Treponema sp.]|nr:hypothetical protein [Treponema sp.]